MIFTVEIGNPESFQDGAHRVAIYMDQERISFLIKCLTRLAQGKPGDHVHFMTDSWTSEGDLSEVIFDESHVLTNHLEIIRVDDSTQHPEIGNE